MNPQGQSVGRASDDYVRLALLNEYSVEPLY